MPNTQTYRPGYEVAAERVLALIIERDLSPGDRLPTEQDLAEHLGFSRSVTREAIKVLAAIGRVSAQRGRGLYVGNGSTETHPTLLSGHGFTPGRMEQVEQLLEFRLVQEAFAAGRAASRATPPHLNRLEGALEDGARALDTDDRELWAEADTRFHLEIARASGNDFIVSALESARQLQAQVVVLALHGGAGGSLRAAHAEHRAILDAIREGNPEAAASAAHQHLEHTIDGYRNEIEATLQSREK